MRVSWQLLGAQDPDLGTSKTVQLGAFSVGDQRPTTWQWRPDRDVGALQLGRMCQYDHLA